MVNLCEYADRLAALYVRRKDLGIGLSHNEQDIEARQLVMTPAEGWPGKNEEARATARGKAYAEDETLQKMRAMLSKLRDELAMVDGEIEAQEVQFKAARWQIRQDTNDVLRARRIQPEPEESENDDPGDVTGAASEAAVESDVYADNSLPF